MSPKRQRESKSLFAAAGLEQDAPRPLPDRLRPQALSDVVGQDHILGPDGALTRMLETRTLGSLIFWGPPGTGKSHLAQAIGHATIQQGHRVLYREAHVLLEELAEAQLAGDRKSYVERVASVPLLIIDDLGMRKLPSTAAEDLLEIIMRRYERASTLLTSNRPVDDWGKLLGDTAAVSALLDRLLHHAHVLQCGPRSWRTQHAASLTKDASAR